MFARCAAAIGAALCLGGCMIEPAGPTQHEFRAIDRDKAELVRVNLNFGAGRLIVGSGTEKLMRADFTYNVPSWKPEVDYHSTAGEGSLTVSEPSGEHGHRAGTHYEWDLRLNRDVPMEIHVHMGAGDADLDLGALTLRNVEVDMGVGKLSLDLRGMPKQDYSVRIRGGVGDATVHLPADVGIDARAAGGIGEIRAPGLHSSDGRYYNDAYEAAKVRIHLDVQGGVGSVKLLSD